MKLINKSLVVSELITDNRLDIMALTKMWHRSLNDIRVQLATPSGYLFKAHPLPMQTSVPMV